MSDEKKYTVLYDTNQTNTLTSSQLIALSTDAQSWANFLAMALSGTGWAKMLMRDKSKPREPVVVKVFFLERSERIPTYESLV